MVSVIINTVNEKPEVLKRAISGYYEQGAQVILSTIEGDPSEYWRDKLPLLDVVTMKKEDHPGKSPKGSFMQLNNALPLIKGDWFCFASGNDYPAKDKLYQERKACVVTGKEVCYSAFWEVVGDSATVKPFHGYDFKKHLKGNFVSDCALISKRLVDKYLPFRTELNNYAYWDLWLRIYEGEGDVFIYNPRPTWYYVQNENDMHNVRKRSPKQIEEARKDRERMLDLHR